MVPQSVVCFRQVCPPAERSAYGGGRRHESDLKLVRDALDRIPDALDRFMQRMRCLAAFLASANLRRGRPLDQETLRDVEQDTLSALWRKLASYRGDAELETWAYRFCDMQMRNAIRRARPRRTESLEQDVVDSRATGADEPDRPTAFERTLARLAPLDAEILRLKVLDGYTFERVAARLDQSTNLVKTRYYRALIELRRAPPSWLLCTSA